MSATHAAPLNSMTTSSHDQATYYVPISDEVQVFEQSHTRGLAVMLKGPTGCATTRFVETMAHKLQRTLITVPCNDALSANDLIRRYLIRHGPTVCPDGTP